GGATRGPRAAGGGRRRAERLRARPADANARARPATDRLADGPPPAHLLQAAPAPPDGVPLGGGIRARATRALAAQGGGARRGRAANACARGVPAPRRADRLLRARLARRPAARGDRGLCQARRAALVRVRAPARARRGRVAAPAAAPRPGLRARRLAVRGAGLHIAPQPP